MWWGIGLQASWSFGICRPSYAPHICHFSFRQHNWSSVNFTVVPVHLNWAKLLAGCSKDFSVELYSEWHLQCAQDVVVEKLQLQGERVCTGGHGAAHQMNLTQWDCAGDTETLAKSYIFLSFLLQNEWFLLSECWFDVTKCKCIFEIAFFDHYLLL